jgi:branched-chain amino acid transport system permease protein
VLLAPAPWENFELFAEQIISGLATGGVYALTALALVLIFRSTDIVNFAQGEMAMFVTFTMYSLYLADFPAWSLILVGITVAFAFGGALERVVIRPVEAAPILTIVVVTLGLFVLLNSLATWIWFQTGEPKYFPTPFGDQSIDLGVARVTRHQVGIMVTALLIAGLLYLLFNHTKIGLAMRATAQNPLASRLMGINVGWMLTLGWALASAVGAVAGMLIAHTTFLAPYFMISVVLYAFAAAVLGGLNSPPGAIVGGFLIGVMENLLGTYTPAEILGAEMKLPLTLLLLVIVLLFRPTGIFGERQVRRV